MTTPAPFAIIPSPTGNPTARVPDDLTCPLLASWGLFPYALEFSAADWSRFRGPNGLRRRRGGVAQDRPEEAALEGGDSRQGSETRRSSSAARSSCRPDRWMASRALAPMPRRRQRQDALDEGRSGRARQTQGGACQELPASGTPACDGEQRLASRGTARVSLNASTCRETRSGTPRWAAGRVSTAPGFRRSSTAGWSSSTSTTTSTPNWRPSMPRLATRNGSPSGKHYRASYTTPYILKRGDRPEELILGTTTRSPPTIQRPARSTGNTRRVADGLEGRCA